MKLAMIVPGGVDRGATQRIIPVLLAQVERIAAVHELHVFALHQEAEPCSYPLLGATVHCVGAGRGATLRAARAILREHRRTPFALLHAVFGGSAAAGAIAGALGRVPLVTHLTGGELAGLPEIGYGGWRRWRSRWRLKASLARSAVVTVPGAQMLRRCGELGITARRLTWGVDPRRWPAVPPRRRESAVARLLFVGSLNRVKDPLTLVRAAAALRDRGVAFQLEMIGLDLLDGAVADEARRLGVADWIGFAGFLTQEELRPRLLRADLLLVSSLHEADPTVLLEAAACGVPAVGTPVGHLAEWAPGAAVTVPSGDPAAFADSVATLLDDEDRRLRLAMEAQRRSLAMDADHTAAQLLELYREVARG